MKESEKRPNESDPKNTPNIAQQALDKPESVLQIGAGVLLSISVFVALGTAIFGSSLPVVPLLVAGLSVILLSLVWSRHAVPTTLAILIIGTMVAPREYLTSIAHMITRTETPIGDYADWVGREKTPSTDDIVKEVLKILTDEGVSVTPEIKEQVSRLLSERELADLWDRVLIEGALVPLEAVIDGEIESLSDSLRSVSYFEEDMNFLRREGLITFGSQRYEEAIATDIGRQIVDYSRSPRDTDRTQ